MDVQAFFTYDVFLSFRGSDTRYGVTGYLYKALTDKGIRTFIHDSELQIGDEITPSLFKAIEESRICIIIFSTNYASSSFCLDELTAILYSYEEERNGRVVFPVFYHVESSVIRHGRGSYGDALAKHEERFMKDGVHRVKKWRTSLCKAANLSGYHFTGDGYEHEFIEAIVEYVCKQVTHVVPLHTADADQAVGIEPRVNNVNSLLDLGSDNVLLLGIYGMGGIGKTTIARAVYDSISDQFEGLCFLNNVRDDSDKFGPMHLQETMLYETCGLKIKLGGVNEGIRIIKQRLSKKKVLLVLDDVNKLMQLEVIAGAYDWFGPGSRIIITTREHHLLVMHGVDIIYEVDELSEGESLDLLCRSAFKTNKVDPSYADILKRVFTFTSGLPLALRAVGSYLFGRNINEWESALDLYERIPHNDIQTILRISFDSLEEEEKDIFLDIACFFNGDKLEYVEDILLARYGVSVRYSIRVLIEKSLIYIDKGLVTLHNLVEDMGKEIVRQESPKEPGERSRLWFVNDVVQVLEDNSGSAAIEILFLDFPIHAMNSNGSKGGEVNWDGEALKNMRNLKTLVIRNGSFNQGPTHLPNSLRVLEWWGYPSPSLPNDFHPKKLAMLKLPESCLRISEPIQGVINLTVLDFSYSDWITHIPDVSGLQNLEKIYFKQCENLTRIHESVGLLEKLRILNVVHCKKLSALPPIRLTSLEHLNLSHCSVLESFPEILGKMENLTELHIMGSPIKELPYSIQNLIRLRKLELHICGMVRLPSSIVMLPELSLMCVSKCQRLWFSEQDKGEELESKSSKTEHLTLSYCNISDELLPIGLAWFANVKDLNLSGNNFETLHACIKECPFLRNLKMDYCDNIQEIKGLPWKLESFSAKGCTSLKYMDLAGESHSLRELILDDCVFLREIIGDLPNLNHFSAKNCVSLTSQCTSMLMNQESVEAGNKMFSLPGKKIPDWFALQSREESTAFYFRNKFPAVSVCLVIGHLDEKPIAVNFSPKVFINGNKLSSGNQFVYNFRVATDHILLFDLRLLKFEDNGDALFLDNEWNHVVVSYVDHITDNEVPIRVVSKYSGIHVFNQISGMEDIRFTIPQKTLINATLDSTNSMMVPSQKIMTKRPEEDQTVVLSPTLKSIQSPSPTSEVVKGLVPLPTFPVKRPLPDVGEEISENLSDEEVCVTAIQKDLPVIQRCSEGDDVELESISCEEKYSSNTEGSDSDDPFDLVNRKLYDSGMATISSGERSGDASMRSIREAINGLELLMVNDLSEVSSDPAKLSELHQLLDLLSTSSHPKVTVEVKEAIVEFKKNVFLSFQEFQSAAESVNKLKNFERQLAVIQQKTMEGKGQRTDLKNTIKKVSLAMTAEISRKKELEAENATLRIQLDTNERELEQVVLNLKNQEEILSTYSTSCASLNEQARALLKQTDDLLAASSGIKQDGEAAELKQSRIKLTWSIDLTSQLNKMKKTILGFFE
ncbi:putative TIR domain, winged helix-turn-helix DNA-binding domain-containing protein [Medicago truncatula]|uniref:Disease resistance protein (TIR-NBS-LRR class) n=1 Tax=Medicago truncatula TaxID=3880 RepID=A0A072TQQ4_MEDTR|nr:TMV resistance protein N isoform X2 [Medicago truncatula]KEH19188.1 disease resistance protein (TIR-NBS-LRR class) [Medicago truncatula]RHN40436.1 putative TIR domain, winged helix-turn-helix DNA-binding domain-containing protein [Medicago truncatula]